MTCSCTGALDATHSPCTPYLSLLCHTLSLARSRFPRPASVVLHSSTCTYMCIVSPYMCIQCYCVHITVFVLQCLLISPRGASVSCSLCVHSDASKVQVAGGPDGVQFRSWIPASDIISSYRLCLSNCDRLYIRQTWIVIVSAIPPAWARLGYLLHRTSTGADACTRYRRRLGRGRATLEPIQVRDTLQCYQLEGNRD